MMPKRAFAPGMLTVLNLFIGFYSVILSAGGNYAGAAWFIILASVFDAFDGKLARATKAFSTFGEELDSLADVVSFGVAPSFLLFQTHFADKGPVGIVVSFFPLLFGSIRLARFNANLSGSDKQDFSGLPIPAMAGTIAAFVIFNYHYWDEIMFESAMMPMVLALSVLMVSNIRFDALPTFTLRKSGKKKGFLYFIIFGVLMIAFFPQTALFPIAIAYISFGIMRQLLHLSRSGLVRNGKKQKEKTGEVSTDGSPDNKTKSESKK